MLPALHQPLGLGQHLQNLLLPEFRDHGGQIGGHLLGGRVAIIQRFGQRAFDDRLQRCGQILPDRGQRRIRLVHDFLHQHVVGAGEGKLAGHDLVEHHSGGKDVGAPIDRLVAQPLRGHIRHRADQVAGAGEAHVLVALFKPRNAKVQQLG